MKKYRTLFVQFLKEYFAYRIRVILSILTQMVTPIAMIFVFSGIGSTGQIGLSQSQIVSYFLLTSLLYLFLNSNIDDFLKQLIQEGTIVNYLTKPLSLIKVALIRDLSWRIGKLVTGLPIIILLIVIYPPTSQPLNSNNPLLIITTVIIGYSLAFLISFSLGVITFWLEEVWGLQNLKYVLFLFLGGVALPYQMFPPLWQKILYCSPFPYLISWPLRIGLSGNILKEFITALLWLFIFLWLTKIVYRLGIKKYSAMGVS